MLTKQCPRCGETKPLTGFNRNKNKPRGIEHRCRDCERDQKLLRKYGITVADFNDLLAAQKDGCAICGSLEPGGKGAFHVDHDHACCPGAMSCGRCVRALLCHRCNTLLGAAKDDVGMLTAAAEYLIHHEVCS